MKIYRFAINGEEFKKLNTEYIGAAQDGSPVEGVKIHKADSFTLALAVRAYKTGGFKPDYVEDPREHEVVFAADTFAKMCGEHVADINGKLFVYSIEEVVL